jgi:hypothetical protein
VIGEWFFNFHLSKGEHAYIKFGFSEKFIHSNHYDHCTLLFWSRYVGCELREATATLFPMNLVNPRWDFVANSPWVSLGKVGALEGELGG